MIEEKKGICGCASKGAGTIGKMLLGAVLIFLGVFLCIRWWLALRVLIFGCLGPLLVLLGLVFVTIAKE